MLFRIGDVSSALAGLELCKIDRVCRFCSALDRWASDASTGELLGEYSGCGKIGSILDVRPTGEPGRGDIDGGGVMDLARGLAWFELVGEAPGDES